MDSHFTIITKSIVSVLLVFFQQTWIMLRALPWTGLEIIFTGQMMVIGKPLMWLGWKRLPKVERLF